MPASPGINRDASVPEGALERITFANRLASDVWGIGFKTADTIAAAARAGLPTAIGRHVIGGSRHIDGTTRQDDIRFWEVSPGYPEEVHPHPERPRTYGRYSRVRTCCPRRG